MLVIGDDQTASNGIGINLNPDKLSTAGSCLIIVEQVVTFQVPDGLDNRLQVLAGRCGQVGPNCEESRTILQLVATRANH